MATIPNLVEEFLSASRGAQRAKEELKVAEEERFRLERTLRAALEKTGPVIYQGRQFVGIPTYPEVIVLDLPRDATGIEVPNASA